MKPSRLPALLLAAVLTAACGARLDAEQVDALAAASRAPGGVVVGVGVRGAGTSGGGTASGESAGARAATAGGGAAATAGGGESGGPGATGDPGTSCAPSGASDVGVSETEIVLGQVATVSGPVPGLSQTAVNAARAYAEYRNATTNGICGRRIRILTGDDRLDSGQNRAETARLIPQVFGFVGGWSVTDDGGASVLTDTNIPDVGLAVSEARASLPNNFSSNPIALDGTSGAGTILRYMYETYQLRSAAVVWPAQSMARARAQGYIRDLESLGMQVTVKREVAITETNYVSVAQEIENAGAEFVITALENSGIARLAQAFQQVGYLPRVPFYGAQTYGPQFIHLAGDAANGALLGITHPIAEERDSIPQLATMAEWYERVNPGAPLDFFSFQGWVAADMFADAIEAAGPSPTRDAVLQVLSTYTAFDADGLVAPLNPAQKQNSTCFMIVTVRERRWERVHPASGFACA